MVLHGSLLLQGTRKSAKVLASVGGPLTWAPGYVAGNMSTL